MKEIIIDKDKDMVYFIVRHGNEMLGDEYKGDKSKHSFYGPVDWCPIKMIGSSPIERSQTLIYRRPFTHVKPRHLIVEGDKVYRIVREGLFQDGDECMGDTEKDPRNTYPETWTAVEDFSAGEIVQNFPTLIVRRLVGSLFSYHQSESKVVKPEQEKPLSAYSIEDLMKWRNSASKRITEIDSQVEYINNVIKEYESKRNKLMKKRHKDASWVSRLNNVLHRKVIKNR